ncbi:hypothetical protein ABW21_db0209416 [Orbilia brochopaga]|nr:hypothetical protein ABW21_db0209416 [Drechslerella brochopaga]
MAPATVPYSDRADFCNVLIVDSPISPINVRTKRVIAEIYQPDEQPITYAQLLEDLKIIFPHLNTEVKDGFQLAFWASNAKGFIQMVHEKVSEEDYPEAPPQGQKIMFGLILHDPNKCQGRAAHPWKLARHITERLGYLPDKKSYGIPTIQSNFSSAAPSQDSSPASTPVKTSGRLQSESAEQLSSIWRVVMQQTATSSFEESVKGRLVNCAISGESNRMVGAGHLLSGPGFESCHIIAQKAWFAYPDGPDIADPNPEVDLFTPNLPSSEGLTVDTLQKRLLKTWDPRNGIVLRADLHAVFDRRMIAIHPNTGIIRVFLPLPATIKYHGKKSNINLELVDIEALKFHWRQCVIENVAARLLVTNLPITRIADHWATQINSICKPQALPGISEGTTMEESSMERARGADEGTSMDHLMDLLLERFPVYRADDGSLKISYTNEDSMTSEG